MKTLNQLKHEHAAVKKLVAVNRILCALDTLPGSDACKKQIIFDILQRMRHIIKDHESKCNTSTPTSQPTSQTATKEDLEAAKEMARKFNEQPPEKTPKCMDKWEFTNLHQDQIAEVFNYEGSIPNGSTVIIKDVNKSMTTGEIWTIVEYKSGVYQIPIENIRAAPNIPLTQKDIDAWSKA